VVAWSPGDGECGLRHKGLAIVQTQQPAAGPRTRVWRRPGTAQLLRPVCTCVRPGCSATCVRTVSGVTADSYLRAL